MPIEVGLARASELAGGNAGRRVPAERLEGGIGVEVPVAGDVDARIGVAARIVIAPSTARRAGAQDRLNWSARRPAPRRGNEEIVGIVGGVASLDPAQHLAARVAREREGAVAVVVDLDRGQAASGRSAAGRILEPWPLSLAGPPAPGGGMPRPSRSQCSIGQPLECRFIRSGKVGVNGVMSPSLNSNYFSDLFLGLAGIVNSPEAVPIPPSITTTYSPAVSCSEFTSVTKVAGVLG